MSLLVFIVSYFYLIFFGYPKYPVVVHFVVCLIPLMTSSFLSLLLVFHVNLFITDL